jgi:hypothetical protein
MSDPNVSLWFDSPQTWVIPVLMRPDSERFPFAEASEWRSVKAAQVCSEEAIWTLNARYPEDVGALMSARVGDWVVEMDDGHRKLFHDADFRARFAVDGAGLRDLSVVAKDMAEDQESLADFQEGEWQRRGFTMAANLLAFSHACEKLADLGTWPDEALTGKPDANRENRWSRQGIPNFSERKGNGMDLGSENAAETVRKALSGELPLTVWITRNIRQEFPADVVQQVMQAISDHGGENGGPMVFESIGRHRDTALDAILRSGSAYTMGIPVEDSLSQKQWENRGIRASSRMVDLAREMLAPLEMEAVRQAHPGDVVSLPFNRDGHFDDRGDRSQNSVSRGMDSDESGA